MDFLHCPRPDCEIAGRCCEPMRCAVGVERKRHLPASFHVIVGVDPCGQQRVYATESDEGTAYVVCRSLARDYLVHHAECGPFREWTFEPAVLREVL